MLIPHELLHLAGFRLMSKRYQYRWGDSQITPLDPMSRWEQLVVTLFPFVVFAIAFVVCTVLVGLIYSQVLRGASFFWFIFGLVLMQVIALYAGTTLVDLRRAYLFIFDKPWHSWTPFDIFFWPVVDWTEVRKKVASDHDKQN